MKFLFLYRYIPSYNFDHFLHMDVVEQMNKMEGIEARCYGHRLHESNPNICITPWRDDVTMAELYEKYNFDVIAVMTKARMFLDYLPKNAMGNTRGEIRQGCWLPKDFSSFNKKIKIAIDEDTHYEEDNSWYKEVGINLIFERHYVNVDRGNSFASGVKHIFLPFSVDTKLFCDRSQFRINMITYTGSVNNMYYTDRTMAVAMLKERGLITKDSPKRKENYEYVNDLNNYVCHLSGQSAYYILPAKIFEIASSGSLLLTTANPKTGMDLVFPEDTYVKFADDGSDLIEKANFILSNPNEVKVITARAKKHILENHTHEIRTRQLVEMLNKEI